MPFDGKDAKGKRIYIQHVIDKLDPIKIQKCVLYGLGLTALTDYL
jgi:polyphosphate kinase 2 (PPK2 family)